ncbi:MAG TPA: hypothetical protein VIU40_04435 [Geobacteraceae bacterium]
MRFKVWLVLWYLCAGVTTAAAAQDYEIRLDRPVRAGERFHVTASGSEEEKSVITVGGELLRDDRENFTIDFDAVMTILEVDAQARPTRAQFSVTKCIKTEAYDQRPLLPPGAVVVAAVKDREEVFTVNGAPVNREVGKGLGLIITLSKGGATDDEIFGTRSRRKVGERWGINAELAARELLDFKLKVAKEDLRGSTSLEQVVREGDRDYLLLAAEFSVARVIPELPPGVVVEKSHVDMKFSGKYPLATVSPAVEESMDMTMGFLARGKTAPEGAEIVVESRARQRLQRRYTQLP